MFQSSFVLTFIFISIRPYKCSKPVNKPIFPISRIFSIVNVFKSSFTIETTILKISFIYSRWRNISTLPLFYSVFKFTFKIRIICKFLPPYSLWYIVFPFSCIFIALMLVIITALTRGLIIFKLSFIYTAIIKYISTLPLSNSIHESSFV